MIVVLYFLLFKYNVRIAIGVYFIIFLLFNYNVETTIDNNLCFLLFKYRFENLISGCLDLYIIDSSIVFAVSRDESDINRGMM